MKRKRILLISNNRREIESIEEILSSTGIKLHLVTVENGKDALDILMGSPKNHQENNLSAKKIRPDIILMDKNLPDMSGSEFLGIMRKYYSLENIKIFLLTDSAENTDTVLSEKFEISGYLQRPFENNPATIKNFKLLEKESDNGRSFMIFSLVPIKAKFKSPLSLIKKSTLKGKASVLKIGFSASIKIAACIAGLSIITGAAIYYGSDHTESAPDRIIQQSTKPDLNSGKENNVELKTDSSANFSGLYTVQSGELDLKPDHSLTFISGINPRNPGYKSAGLWKPENDSTITVTFFKDSSTINYKFLSDNQISSRNIFNPVSVTKKDFAPVYHYPSFLTRIKKYYPDGKVEWTIDNKRLVGNCTYYFQTGEILSRGRMKNGLREGKWKYYDKNGKKTKTEFYRKGINYANKKPWTI